VLRTFYPLSTYRLNDLHEALADGLRNERRLMAQKLQHKLEDSWPGDLESYESLMPEIIAITRALGEKDDD